jgi:hypothetical protein
MKQTAVEWLVNELEEHYVFYDIKNTVAFQQAKAMEKEQIIDAFQAGDDRVMAEQYYKETFKQD